jgi:hypothetical protein
MFVGADALDVQPGTLALVADEMTFVASPGIGGLDAPNCSNTTRYVTIIELS